MGTTPIVVPTDAVTLHRFDPDAIPSDETLPGEQIGEPIPVTEPGTVTFPAYVGEPTPVRVAAWRDGSMMCWTEVGERDPWGEPMRICEGETVMVRVPFTATLSSA